MRTIDIPQANSVSRLLAALAALDDGCATTAQVAAALGGLDHRHGDYYLHALRVLGLAFYARKVALRTTLGSEIAALPPEAQRQELARIVAATPPAREVLELLDRRADGVALDEVTALLQGLARLSPTTAQRRAQGVLSWLHTLQLAVLVGRRWRRVVDQNQETVAPAAGDGPTPGDGRPSAGSADASLQHWPQGAVVNADRHLEVGNPAVVEWLLACGIDPEELG